MGIAMASNIQKALSSGAVSGDSALRFYNRTASRGAPLTELGGRQCQSVTQLVEACSVVFISVGRSRDLKDQTQSS